MSKDNKKAEAIRAEKIKRFGLNEDANDEQIKAAELNEERIKRAKAVGISETSTIEEIEIAEGIKAKNGEDFVNPFARGTSYADFIKALGKKSVSEYLEGKEKAPGVPFEPHDIEWLNAEIESHKTK